MKIEIETNDKEFVLGLMETKEIEVGTEVEIPGNATLTFSGKALREAMFPGMPEVLEFIISFSSGAAASIIANWLNNKFKDKADVVRFDRKVVEVNKDGIQRIIEETIKVENS
jgi:hypothetical protein